MSLTEALAEELGLDFDDADELVDAPVHELASDDGLVYGHQFDFSELELAPRLRRKLQRKDGDLKVTVSADFYDRVHGREAKPRRHYVHGDQSETDASRYFCASCNLFVPAEHFDAEHPGKNEDRFRAALVSWQRRPARTKINVRRPAAAKNVLEAAANEQRTAWEASRSSFHRWLEQQAGRDDPVGDLARDVKGDWDFPASDATRTGLREYLVRSRAAPDAVRAFEDAWREFKGTSAPGAATKSRATAADTSSR